MKYHLIGFFISALLHTGVFVVLNNIETKQTANIVKPTSLTLAMFKAEPIKLAPPIETPKPITSKPASEPISKPAEKSVELPKPIIKKRVTKKETTKKAKPKKKVVKRKPKTETKKKISKKKKAKKTKSAPRPAPKIKKRQHHRVVAKAPPTRKSVAKAHPAAKAHQVVRRQAPARQVVTPHKQTRSVKAHKPSVKPAQIARIEMAYKTRLHQLIGANKRYPKRAKRMGKQGTVRVSFTIVANGLIKNIRIIKSSGNSGLDKAAIKAIKKSSGKLPFSKGINRKQWVITVPITYNLN